MRSVKTERVKRNDSNRLRVGGEKELALRPAASPRDDLGRVRLGPDPPLNQPAPVLHHPGVDARGAVAAAGAPAVLCNRGVAGPIPLAEVIARG